MGPEEERNWSERYTPSTPTGHTLELGDAAFLEYERLGSKAVMQAAFVLVAGGLGERIIVTRFSWPACVRHGT